MPKRRHASKSESRKHSSRGAARGPASSIRTWSIVALVLVVAAGAYLLLRPRTGLPSEVQASQAHEMYQAGATFVDVRTQAEWAQGHIAGSLLIPLEELPSRLTELPKDKDIVVVCRSGVRSKEGTTVLKQAGFTRVTCLSGGLQAWVAAGYPLVQ